MIKLNKSDFFVVIRSAKERSLPLCIKSVQKNELNFEKNEVRPFWKAVIRTFEIGITHNRKYTIGLDADIILYDDAIKRIIEVISKTPSYWKYDFALQDRFYSNPIFGIHVYDTSVLKRRWRIILKILKRFLSQRDNLSMNSVVKGIKIYLSLK